MGETDWKLIEGFKAVHYFEVKTITNNNDSYFVPCGSEEKFIPSRVFFIHLQNVGPTRNIGIIGEMKDEADANMFLLLGCDDVFILNDEGKTIERI